MSDVDDVKPNDIILSSHPILDDDEEEEYKLYQAKISAEIEEAKKKKAEEIINNSSYTTFSTLTNPENDECDENGNKNSSSHPTDSPFPKRREELNIDSLLRLFKSDFFDTWIGISYLFKYTSPGVHDYICNQLYTMNDASVEFYLIDLCTMLVHNLFNSNALERFIMDKCKQSVHFALQINWLFFSTIIGDNAVSRCSESLQAKCEIAVVNGNLDQAQPSSLFEIDHCYESASDLSRMHSSGTLTSYIKPTNSSDSLENDEINAKIDGDNNNESNESNENSENDKEGDNEDNNEKIEEKNEIITETNEQKLEIHSLADSTDNITVKALEKMHRCEYFYQILNFVEGLGIISDKLRSVPVPQRQKGLVKELKQLNESLYSGIYLPLWEADSPHYCIIRIAAEDGIVLKSRERVPFILLFEAITSTEYSSSPNVHKVAKNCNDKVQQIKETLIKIEKKEKENENIIKVEAKKPSPALDSEFNYKKSPFGEPFAKKQERIKNKSPYGDMEGWHLRSVIIKYGDDCKQEYLALQLIGQFKKIFDDANIPCYLRPYGILVNSPDSGIIETITDAISLDGLKKFYSTETRVTLSDHFRSFYGHCDSHEYKLALRNFVESLAGYSLVAYLLQIKDRHNGNILIDASGHLIHIDFGFMLTNSPGNINAESFSFKFTQEYVELMGGFDSSMYAYFKGLMRSGYIEVRKHYEKIFSLVEIMSIDSTLPCFSGGIQNALLQLRDRFNLSMTEKQVDEFLDNMIEQSYDSWRTRYYDRFQYMTNSILI